MPAKEACLDCHGEGKKPFEKEIAALPASAWKPYSDIPDLSFSHARHAKASVACKECHGEIAASGEVTEAFRPREEACRTCHEARSVEASCRTCHFETRMDRKPSSHTASWERTHGLEARGAGRIVHGSTCDRCHGDDACARCHRERAPHDHNETWRVRTHGLVAEIDRDRCAACHTEDMCVRCHLSGDVLPRSHRRGSWGAPRAMHCLSCHDSPELSSCSACHASAPSHLLAPMPPPRPGHFPGSDCRSCHVSLTHADDGGSCERCHHP